MPARSRSPRFRWRSIRGSFNAASDEAKERDDDPRTTFARACATCSSHPVLRNISLMMALINFVTSTTWAQLVLFAHERLGASQREIGVLFAAGSAGVVVTGLLAGRLRKRFSFTALAMTSLMLDGRAARSSSRACTSYWVALPIWAAPSGLGILFNINTGSLRQAIVPNHMLSRVLSIAGVLAWSAIPAGALVGGWADQRHRQRRARLRRDRDHHDLHRGRSSGSSRLSATRSATSTSGRQKSSGSLRRPSRHRPREVIDRDREPGSCVRGPNALLRARPGRPGTDAAHRPPSARDGTVDSRRGSVRRRDRRRTRRRSGSARTPWL